MSPKVYKQTPDYTARLETREGLLFLHLDVPHWGLSVLRELRAEIKKALLHFEEMGHDVVFICSKDSKSVKFWGLVKPVQEVIPIEGGYLSYWYTGDGRWD